MKINNFLSQHIIMDDFLSEYEKKNKLIANNRGICQKNVRMSKTIRICQKMSY